MWRTPHPDPDPLDGPTTGLSGAVAIGMAYLADGTVLFAERPHPLAPGIPNNPLIVNVSDSTLHYTKGIAQAPDYAFDASRQMLTGAHSEAIPGGSAVWGSCNVQESGCVKACHHVLNEAAQSKRFCLPIRSRLLHVNNEACTLSLPSWQTQSWWE